MRTMARGHRRTALILEYETTPHVPQGLCIKKLPYVNALKTLEKALRILLAGAAGALYQLP